jgi:hypothetical protein
MCLILDGRTHQRGRVVKNRIGYKVFKPTGDRAHWTGQYGNGRYYHLYPSQIIVGRDVAEFGLNITLSKGVPKIISDICLGAEGVHGYVKCPRLTRQRRLDRQVWKCRFINSVVGKFNMDNDSLCAPVVQLISLVRKQPRKRKSRGHKRT